MKKGPFGPVFNGLQNSVELYRTKIGAGNETRTRDPDLGKVVLYQLSYSRLGVSLLYKHFQILERETRLELATPTLARSCSTN